jgi:rhodanese-related sulfurtransferase
MHELLKTQRISIAVLVIALVLLIGLMAKTSPKSPFIMTATEMLTLIPTVKHTTVDMAKKVNGDTNNYTFIDLRSPYDFEVSHIPNAKNIPTAFLLDDENKELLQQYLDENRKVILYGSSQRQAMSPWLLLTEIGFSNITVLESGFDCYQGNSASCYTESAKFDYAKIANLGEIKRAAAAKEAAKPKPKPKPVKKKKVVPVKKKVKREAEGGC